VFFFLNSEFRQLIFCEVFYDAVGIRGNVVDGRMMLADEMESIWNGASVA
jgi:hypothetical protein